MKPLKWLAVVVSAYVAVFASGYGLFNKRGPAISESSFLSLPVSESINSDHPVVANPATSRYQLDASRSKFIAHAFAGGLLWFKGRDHLVAVRDFSGQASLDPDSIGASSLEIVAKAASMEETSSAFTDVEKKIINKELREIVLLPDQYPDIVFKSTNVTGKSTGAGQYDLKIAGNLTLHGVTRPIKIPTRVSVTGNELRAQGDFSIDRGNFNVKATSAFHGLVRVRDNVKFEFDIVGHRF